MKSLLILGRQPALGLAELESLFGAEKLRPIGREAALIDIDPEDIPFDRLGGSLKLARVITELTGTDWRTVESHLTDTLPSLLSDIPEGKLKLGLSAYGLRVRANDINATGLRLKKIIKAEGRSIRIVPNKSAALNSAQVLHNQLTSPTGVEIIVVCSGNKTILARTKAEQDIEAYAKRDQGRPMRDAKVGMLPPKLAQIIINLATSTADSQQYRLLDPFCGTGVLLQEALLMGFDIYGTDLEPRMINYTNKNLRWLLPDNNQEWKLEVGDATTHQWQAPVDLVACETFLGKPLSTLPPRDHLTKIIAECERIHYKFLTNIATQIQSGTRLCLAVPAWRTKNSFLHLKALAKLDELGYNRQKFVHVRTEDLIYHREDQIVARELVVLVKK